MIQDVSNKDPRARFAKCSPEYPRVQSGSEINAIMADIIKIEENSAIGDYGSSIRCGCYWPQLLSKAQLLMFLTGIPDSTRPQLFHADAVLLVGQAVEHVQKCVTACSICVRQEQSVFSMLAHILAWFAKNMSYALNYPSVTQGCSLRVGESTLEGKHHAVGFCELLKYRSARILLVVKHMSNRLNRMSRDDSDFLLTAVRTLLPHVEAALEGLPPMAEVLLSESV